MLRSWRIVTICINCASPNFLTYVLTYLLTYLLITSEKQVHWPGVGLPVEELARLLLVDSCLPTSSSRTLDCCKANSNWNNQTPPNYYYQYYHFEFLCNNLGSQKRTHMITAAGAEVLYAVRPSYRPTIIILSLFFFVIISIFASIVFLNLG